MSSNRTTVLKPKHDRRPLLLDRIRQEYTHLPGLILTPAQARRLWSLESSTCLQLLDGLVTDGFLTVSESRYARPSA